MDQGAQEFSRLVEPILKRFLRQNGGAEPVEADCTEVAGRLWSVVERRGLPPPPVGVVALPGELPESEVTPLVTEVLGERTDPILAEAIRQLVKACFYPEFTDCRESYRAAAADGSCRRQEQARVLRRISGSPCVDCPYWLSHAAENHRALVVDGWRGRLGDLTNHWEIFLPEDFRELRQWVRRRARNTKGTAGN